MTVKVQLARFLVRDETPAHYYGIRCSYGNNGANPLNDSDFDDSPKYMWPVDKPFENLDVQSLETRVICDDNFLGKMARLARLYAENDDEEKNKISVRLQTIPNVMSYILPKHEFDLTQSGDVFDIYCAVTGMSAVDIERLILRLKGYGHREAFLLTSPIKSLVYELSA